MITRLETGVEWLRDMLGNSGNATEIFEEA
jgi:hypothetical protein